MTRLTIAMGILTCWCRAAEYRAPLLRHVNTVIVSSERAVDANVQCIAHGIHAYTDQLTVRMVGTSAGTVKLPPVPFDGTASITVPAAQRAAFVLESGWNLAYWEPPETLPHAYRSEPGSPLQTVREWGPLHFFVPPDTRYFNIWVQASVRGEGIRCIIRDPTGVVIRDLDDDFDQRTKIQILVAEEQRGHAWSITLATPQTPGLVADDVNIELGRHLPPVLAPRPEWARRFAGSWRYDADKEARLKQLADQDPARSPYRPQAAAELSEFYARHTGPNWRTSLPFTYVLDYGQKHLGNPEYVPMIASAPPVLLHVGKDVSFNHGWGPVRALGGENQAYGFGDAITRLSPEATAQRVSALRTMVDDLHRCGVRWVTPYICSMTVNGDPERRSGFWEFYDHWNDYTALGLPPRPSADPLAWLQTTPDGKPKIYYNYRYPNEFYPPFRDNHRFAACWYAEGWRTWLLTVVRSIAGCGYDGVFVDNGTSQRSTSAGALAAFRAYLAKTFTPAEAQGLLGVADLESVGFPERKGNVLLRAEQERFWCETIRAQMAAIRNAGSDTLGRDFLVFPNGGRPNYIQRALRDCDLVMFEKSIGLHGTHPGMVHTPVVDGITMQTRNDNIFDYVVVRDLRARVQPVILSRPGYPKAAPHQRLNQDAARLGLAECAAFSGGGGFLFRPRFGLYHDVLNEYREFFETRPQLYAGLVPAADTVLLAGLEQSWLGNSAHMGLLKQTTDAFVRTHTPFDVLAERRWTEADLQPYTTLAATGLESVSNDHLELILGKVSAGCNLLVVGRFAETDHVLRHRDAPVIRQIAALEPGQTMPWGKGYVRKTATVEARVESLPRIGLTCAETSLAPHISVALYRTPDRQRTVLHLVNYTTPLGVDPPPRPKPGAIELSMPSTCLPAHPVATLHVPGKQAHERLVLKAEPEALRVTVPDLGIYAVVEFTAAPAE